MYDEELDRFKRDIHLVQYALERHGYTRDKTESSRHSHVLRHQATDDKIVVRQSDGHWTYFSVRHDRDNGTVIDFVQRRGIPSLGEIRKHLRDWLGTPRPPLELPPERRSEHQRLVTRAPAEAFAAARIADNSPYLNARGIRPATLTDARFAGTWRIDERGNTLFLHRDLAGDVTGFEMKNRGFTGFSTGGHKTAWQSAAQPDDRVLVIAETAIDALSYHQLHRELAARTRYLSTAGTPSNRQLDLLDRAVAQLPRNSLVVAAVDADLAGTKLSKQVKAIAERHVHVSFRHHTPTFGKDWNDVLCHTERDYIRSLPVVVRALHHTPCPEE
jgi:hypothetical protein